VGNLAESGWDESVILDIVHLSNFTGNDPDFECQVLDIFMDNAPGYLEALSQTEQDGWKMRAHKLKGAARSIGAWQLARAGERAEQMSNPPAHDPKRIAILKTLEKRLADLGQYIEARKQKLMS